MNRLDDMIARLLTQRACLDEAARLVAGLPGSVLEIGLGRGRTYSHLRQLFAGREIFAFDWDNRAWPDACPDGGYLVLGDFRQTLPAAAGRLTRPAALAHSDFGSPDRQADAALAQDIAGPIVGLMAPRGLVVSDRPLAHDRLAEIDGPAVDLPAGIGTWPYFLYRVAEA